MNKYRITFEIVIDVDADNEEEATVLADEEFSKGNFNLYPYIEELDNE